MCPASPLPPPLRRADGADIIKRNAARKKKYLLVFPGGAKLPPGARVGELTGLDTRTPVLYVQFGGGGRLKMRGVLVFPRNGFVMVKGSVGGNRAVQVVDIFETIVMFSEWAWVGEESVNPGQLPEPLPEWVREREEGVAGVWKGGVGGGRGTRKKKKGEEGEGLVVADDEDEEVVAVEEGSEDGGREDKEEGLESWDGEEERSGQEEVMPRSNPRRKRKVVNYAKLMEDEEAESAREEGSDERADAEEGDPGYDLQADLEKLDGSD